MMRNLLPPIGLFGKSLEGTGKEVDEKKAYDIQAQNE
jgi:hypothetical protein